MTDRRQQRFGLAAVGLALCTLTACSPGGGQVSEIAPAGTASASAPVVASPSSDPTQAATAAVLAAYSGMRQAQVAAEDSSSTADVDLSSYASGKAFVEITASVASNAAKGLVMTGSPILNPKVTALDLAGHPPTATVTDCMDLAGWRLLLQSTHQDMTAASTYHRFISISQAQLGPNGWLITETSVDRSKPC